MDPSAGELVGWHTTPDGTAAVYVGTQGGAWWYRIGTGAPVGPYPSHPAAADAGRAAIGIDGVALMQLVRTQAGSDGQETAEEG